MFSRIRNISLIILSLWLLFISAFVYRFSSSEESLILKLKLDRAYLTEISGSDFNLIESKVLAHAFSLANKQEPRIVNSPVWISNVINLVIFDSAFSVWDYKTKLDNEIVFRDYLMIYPFHFFF